MKNKEYLLKTNFRIVVGFLILSLFYTCKDKDCPAFPESMKVYFPYNQGDMLKFTDANDTIKLLVSNAYASKPYSEDACSKCACNETFFNFSTENSLLEKGNLSYKITGNIGFDNINGPTSFGNIKCVFETNNKDNSNESLCVDDFNNNRESTIHEFPLSSDLIANFWDDTVVLSKPSVCRINNVTIIKGQGIVSFYDTQTNTLWRKVE